MERVQAKVEALAPPLDLDRLSEVELVRKFFRVLHSIPGVERFEEIFHALTEPQREPNAELLTLRRARRVVLDRLVLRRRRTEKTWSG